MPAFFPLVEREQPGSTTGWKKKSSKGVEFTHYTMIKVGDVGIGGLMTPQGDVPTSRVSYVSVADVDATAEKVKAAGGATHMDAFDVPGVGRMQPVSDAQGGMFCLFKAETADPSRVEGPGSLHWNELWTQAPSWCEEGDSHPQHPKGTGT